MLFGAKMVLCAAADRLAAERSEADQSSQTSQTSQTSFLLLIT
jgi:hypothetical protein